MKKNYVARLGTLALVLGIMSTCVIGNTLARYVGESTGTGTVAVAAWNVKMKKGADELAKAFDFTLAETKKVNNKVASGFVAPGDEGVLDYIITDTGSNVEYIYSVKLDTSNFTGKGINIKFYKDEAHTEAWTDIVDATAAINTTMETGKIYWVWKDEEANNADDTKAGIAAVNDLKFTVTLTASQVINSPVTGG